MQIPITIEPDDRSWQDYANCLGVDPDLFFPERGASTREAKEVCRGCVVREDCLEYALVNGEKFGIWGGMSERERRRLRRQRALARRAGRPPDRPRSGRRRRQARLDRPIRRQVELGPLVLAAIAVEHRRRAPAPPARRRSIDAARRSQALDARGRRPRAGPSVERVDEVHRHLDARRPTCRPSARTPGRRIAAATCVAPARGRRVASQTLKATSTGRAPTARGAGGGVRGARARVGREVAEGVAAHVGQRALRAVEEARHPCSSASHVGEARRARRCASAIVAAVERDEGHHVDHPEAGVDARRAPEVEALDRPRWRRARGASSPDEREHRAVVVRVGVHVEQVGAGGRRRARRSPRRPGPR